MQFSYETVGNSSYLVAVFEGGTGIVNYQLQMLANNDIKNIIKANKRQKNEDVLVSYNITSKIALAQMDSKNKIPKVGLIKIIEGALTALEDIEEYQLVSSGIVFDEEYIFVKPGNYEPSFIYVPNSMEDSGIEPLKNFILSLIMGSKVEISNDNFVQVLLETLNNPALTTKELKKLCDKYKSDKPKIETKKTEPAKVETPPVYQQPVQTQQTPIQPVNIPQTNIQSQERKPNIPVMPNGQIPVAKKNDKKEDKKNKAKAENNEKNPAKTKFLIFQIVFVGLFIACIMSGILNDANGNIDIKYLFAIVLGIAVVDFVIYREMFVNKKADGEDKKKESKPAKNNAKKPTVSMPGKDIPARPAMPGKEIPKAPVKTPVNNAQQQSVQQETPVVEQPVQQQVQIPVAQAIPQPTYVAPAQTQQYGQMSDFESEDTVVLDDNNSDGAYLEYFENGLSTKIKLTKENFMIGKLRGQCDFVLSNNKISKMHAEFITRGTDYFVKDYNSTNGTYINGSNQRIASNAEYQIFNGDRITLANVDMTFRC